MKKIIALLSISILLISLASSCKQQKVATAGKNSMLITGTWKLIEENGKKVTWKVHIKNFTDTHFAWYWATNENITMSDAMGTYTFDGASIVETLNIASPSFANYIGTTATLKVVEITNDTLRTEGIMNADGVTYTETWVKMK